MTTTHKILKLSFSEAAWDMLANVAAETGWLNVIRTQNTHGATTRHISRFFAMLATLDYEDARPTNLRDTCVWIEGERSHQHRLALPLAAIAKLAATAIAFRIPPRFYQFAALYEQSPLGALPNDVYAWAVTASTAPALAAVTLEAIGLKWLRPVAGFPSAPANLYSARTHRRLNSKSHADVQIAY